MRQTQKPRMVNLLMLTVAGMINAFGITLFMTPVKLYDSGISGTSMLLEQITPSCLSLSLFLLILNIPLFLVGLKKQGGLFTFYAIYTVGIYSLFAWLITNIFPIDVSIASPLAGTDLLLCALFGGVISGIGSGLAIRYGGAMDGIEVMAVIFAKRAGVTVGTFENIGKLRKEDAFSAWMYRIVANMCKQKMREYYQRGEELTEENGGWDGYVWGDTREEYIEVRRAFLTMDEEDRMIVGMHVFGGYKTREIAQILAMNENTVRSREHRALQRMEKQLKGLR